MQVGNMDGIGWFDDNTLGGDAPGVVCGISEFGAGRGVGECVGSIGVGIYYPAEQIFRMSC